MKLNFVHCDNFQFLNDLSWTVPEIVDNNAGLDFSHYVGSRMLDLVPYPIGKTF